VQYLFSFSINLLNPDRGCLYCSDLPYSEKIIRMSYLHTPRLIFSGDFMANVSTANNDVTHYNNQTFQPAYQQRGEIGPPATNGWWNPEGTAAFEFRNCSVKKITLRDGTSLTDPKHDPVIGLKVAGADSRSPGKMTDLDPQMQMCSQLWGVKVCLFNASGVPVMEADLLTSPFNDLQPRQYKAPFINGQPYGGTWTSVLTNIKWAKQADESVFLKELRATTQHDKLSLNMHQFGYYKTSGNRFCLGRVLGSIAPYFKGEPEMFAPARRLYGIYEIHSIPETSKRQCIFTYSNFIVEQQTKWLHLDLGGSFPLLDPMGGIEPIWSLTVAVANTPVLLQMSTALQTITPDQYTPFGKLGSVWQNNWLNESGGIVSFSLPEEVLLQLRSKQLLLIAKTANSPSVVVAREPENGYMTRVDNPVLRIDEGEQKQSQVWVYQWGEPVSATVELTLAAPAKTNFGGSTDVPLTGTPPDAVKFPATVTTDSTGKADLFVSGSAPRNPRGYIDGQIYFINYQVLNQPNPNQYRFDQVVVHLRDHYLVPENPT
jgi:hypothetical protein